MPKSWKITLITISPMVLIIAAVMVMHFHAKRSLEAYKRDLIAAGVKLTPQELAPLPVPASSNGAILLQSAQYLSRLSEIAPPVMHAIVPGRAQVGWKDPNLMADIDFHSTNG